MTDITPDRPSSPPEPTSRVRFIDTPEYRRYVYKWMRTPTRMLHGPFAGRMVQRTALQAWRHSREYVEAIR